MKKQTDKQKSRILHLLRILQTKTDSQQGLTLPEIQQALEEAGIPVERKALYRDFDSLAEFGYKVEKLPTRPVSYYLETREIPLEQVTLLVDAVQSCRAISQSTSLKILRNLKTLCSDAQADRLNARIHVLGRIKSQNESVFHTLAILQQAIAQHKEISFDYKRYNTRMQEQLVLASDGKKRVKTPLFVVYSGEFYYLLAYDEDSQNNIRSYRVDRMANVLLLGKAPASHKAPKGFDLAEFERHTLGMYNVKPRRITLHADENVISNLVDIFGTEDVTCAAARGGGANITVKAAPSPVFFGQIAQFGGAVQITGPESVVQDFRNHLKQTLKAHYRLGASLCGSEGELLCCS